MKNKYFMGWLKSFELGYALNIEALKKEIFETENKEFDVVVFRLPKKQSQELIYNIEKMLQNKLD